MTTSPAPTKSATHRTSGGRRARNSGIRFERLVVRILASMGCQPARNLEYQGGRHAGRDIEFVYPGGPAQAASCKYGRQVPLSAYGHLLHGPIDILTIEGERVIVARFQPGHAWLSKSIGDCDQLWFQHPGWPIVQVLGPKNRLK